MHSFSLKEISQWTSNESSVTIPSLQRGLVWKPAQVELLWDSILRGFPIGSFMLSDAKNNKYYLMDGQQRFNAISIGYGTVENAKAVLWLDITPKRPENSTRTFWIKACTISHPWGYQNNDECGGLSANERRLALKSYGMEGKNIYNSEIDLVQTWPYKAVKPLPLQFLLSADMESPGAFVDSILKTCKESDYSFCRKFLESLTDSDKLALEGFYDSFKRLQSYKVSCNLLPDDVISKESEQSSGEITSLETLFNRINTGGTRMSVEDLNYSAIKAYWEDIKEKNDTIAENYMPPAKLVMLAFRLALTKPDDDSFRKDLTVKQIRSLANKEKEHDKISDIYNQLDDIMRMIDTWLGVNESTPPILRTSIARNSPEVFLLLMYFAKEKCNLDPSFIKALAFYLHWFSVESKTIANEIYHRCKDGITKESILQALSCMKGKECIVPLYTPEEMKSLFSINRDKSWRIWSEDFKEWKDFINRVCWFGHSETKEMLLYAQREFMNDNFSMYDPARQDMWDSHNRPWDYDHITPQDWMKYRGKGPFKEYCVHWLWNIGNMAAIPFETNRAKSDQSDYDYYLKNSDGLLFDIRTIDIKRNLTAEPDMSYKFASITWDRCCHIYERCYEMLKPVHDELSLTQSQIERKQMLTDICNNIDGAKIYFYSDGREYLLTRDDDWTRRWIACGVTCGNFFVCVWKEYTHDEWHIGLHRIPKTLILKDIAIPDLDNAYSKFNNGSDQWWYAKKYATGTNTEDLINEINYLLSQCKYDNQTTL